MASKSKRRRRVLGASCILAALIVGASSFAWFTSKDEVTNRLSASADYGVTIAEDFTPPENWIPGQKIDKNVSVVNTGNVDSFARVWLEGEFNLVKEGTGLAYASAGTPTPITDNARLAALNFEKTGNDYVKLLSKDQTLNPANSNTNTTDTYAYSEVQAMQAGGYLAYAPSGAVYQYILNQNKAVDVIYGSDTTKHAVTDIVAGSIVKVGATAAAPSTASSVTTYVAPTNQAGDIDSDTFMPTTTGLYLFRRNMDVNNVQTDKEWEYSGYYYVTSGQEDGTWAKQGKYYALKTKVDGTDANSTDTVYVDGITLSTTDSGTGVTTYYVDTQTGAIKPANIAASLANVKLFTAVESVVKDDAITWEYSAGKLTATVTATKDIPAEKISVDVGLVNVVNDTTTDKWYIASPDDADRATKRDTFYYTNDIEEGDTTAQLVDSVTLNQNTKQTAYIAFDFDLIVKMDAIQVTIADDGKEAFGTVSSGWDVGSTKAVKQKAEATSALEIDNITWANVS